MANDNAKPEARADVDPNFEAQVKAMQTQSTAISAAALTGGQVLWLMPAKRDWKGGLFDIEGMASPFSRAQANQWYVDATSDGEQPGTTGDLVVTTLQVDLLACLERSFRSRHTMTRPRAVAHAAARRRGHGHDKGPLVQCQLEFVRGLVKESKA